MQIEILQNKDSFKQLAPHWNTLLEKGNLTNPFLCYEWMNAWVESYPDDYSPYILKVTEHGNLTAIIPLARDKNKKLVFMGYPFNDFANFILTDNKELTLDAVFDFLFTHKQDWDMMLLDQVGEHADFLAYLRQPDKQKRYNVFIQKSDSCPEMLIDDPEEARKKYNKKHLRTHINWFNKQGELINEIHETPDKILPAMESLFTMHIDRRDKTPSPSHFIHEKHKNFYRTFLKALAPIDKVKMFHIHLDHKTDLAMFLTFMNCDTMFLYTTSFDDNYAKRSPGQIALKYIMDYALENGITKIDFARGDEGYKDRYTNTVKQNYMVKIFPGSLARLKYTLYYKFKKSGLVEVLYRNRKVQTLKFIYIYHKRVSGLTPAVKEVLKALFKK